MIKVGIGLFTMMILGVIIYGIALLPGNVLHILGACFIGVLVLTLILYLASEIGDCIIFFWRHRK